jgi:hypothetical protein
LATEADFWHAADQVVLMGDGAYHFVREAARAGVNPERFTYAEHDDVGEVFEAIVELCGPRTLVVGLANIGDQGLQLARLFRNRQRAWKEAS